MEQLAKQISYHLQELLVFKDLDIRQVSILVSHLLAVQIPQILVLVLLLQRSQFLVLLDLLQLVVVYILITPILIAQYTTTQLQH